MRRAEDFHSCVCRQPPTHTCILNLSQKEPSRSSRRALPKQLRDTVLSGDPTGEWGHQGEAGLAGESCWAEGRLLHGSQLSQGPDHTLAFRGTDEGRKIHVSDPGRLRFPPSEAPSTAPPETPAPVLLRTPESTLGPISPGSCGAWDSSDDGSSYCTNPRALWGNRLGGPGFQILPPTPIRAVSHTRVPTPEATTAQSGGGRGMLLVRMDSCPSSL